MNILTVNSGSSSVRLALIESDGETLKHLQSKRYVTSGEFLQDHQDSPFDFIKEINLNTLSGVVHRVVHGGNKFTQPCIIDRKTEQEIEKLSYLAPLHNPVALEWIRKIRILTGETMPQIAVFDTAFFHTLPHRTKYYALPGNLAERYGICRFGFHGIAHKAMWQHWCAIKPELDSGGSILTLQLGAGSSIAAIKQGEAIDTSMGFTPLEGLIMATRSGDLDPGVITYLLRKGIYTTEQLDDLLNSSSGLLGLSEISADMRVLLQSNLPAARLAVESYCYRVKKYIGAYIAALGSVDAIIFGGGIGEHVPEIRELILNKMEIFGIKLDYASNNSNGIKEGKISPETSDVDIYVVYVDEATVMAEEAVKILKG